MIRKQLKKEFEKIQLPVPLEGQFKKVYSFGVHTPVAQYLTKAFYLDFFIAIPIYISLISFSQFLFSLQSY